ncbi:MAG: hypothetical protein COX06_03310 [Candidatus Zambryskibacteria bacterium CG22_combo_CG10-13_8_21_14_all_42_17]|uniref:Uncharacterized protein n=1 Tax=Candidatus Zambryskibacteria bacterium CG22_combo_CG10-13_8_21_14_all_42_17 TaxID=1975118 RepID=A0A2H0BCS5_9BACT|nr:MAG: hypothetical protein COX06_03310 [Candidatus Zambryskibacteria bacterium CG22_combo_CG10-13_8_21_14_all_42_17]
MWSIIVGFALVAFMMMFLMTSNVFPKETVFGRGARIILLSICVGVMVWIVFVLSPREFGYGRVLLSTEEVPRLLEPGHVYSVITQVQDGDQYVSLVKELIEDKNFGLIEDGQQEKEYLRETSKFYAFRTFQPVKYKYFTVATGLILEINPNQLLKIATVE